jgi:hypothetical protein
VSVTFSENPPRPTWPGQHPLAHVALHESGHTVAAWRLGRQVEFVSVEPDDGLWGRTRLHVSGEARDLVIRLAGYLAEGEAPVPWPPTFDEARTMKLENIGALVAELRLDRATYTKLANIALEMMADPDVRRAVALVASALLRVPVLNEAQLATLLGNAEVSDS